MYPYLLEIGPITIASFGAMVALGFLAALQILNHDLKRKGLDEELGSTIITTCMIGGLVGAKLYFIFFETPPNQDWERAPLRGAGPRAAHPCAHVVQQELRLLVLRAPAVYGGDAGGGGGDKWACGSCSFHNPMKKKRGERSERFLSNSS